MILAKRDLEIMEFNFSLFDQMVNFLLSLKLERKDIEELLDSFDAVIRNYPITCRNIKNIS